MKLANIDDPVNSVDAKDLADPDKTESPKNRGPRNEFSNNSTA